MTLSPLPFSPVAPALRGLKVVALAGGVGGARFAHGLAQCLAPEDLTVIVNVGDDFLHWGLKICPDLDTVCYTLAGLSNIETGWGRTGESWNVLEEMKHLGAPAWFNLGDRDLATHLERTRRLQSGEPLSQVTHDFCKKWGVALTVLPASDHPLPTRVYTQGGELPFQEYFVKEKCQPVVTGFHFGGIEHATPAPGVLEAIQQADVVMFCPSNPWVSIDPILAIPGILAAIRSRYSLAISPIIGGKTVKGPAAKMFTELGIAPSALAVAQHYRETLTAFVLDRVDAGQAEAVGALGLEPFVTDTLMLDIAGRKRLAEEVLWFVRRKG